MNIYSVHQVVYHLTATHFPLFSPWHTLTGIKSKYHKRPLNDVFLLLYLNYWEKQKQSIDEGLVNTKDKSFQIGAWLELKRREPDTNYANITKSLKQCPKSICVRIIIWFLSIFLIKHLATFSFYTWNLLVKMPGMYHSNFLHMKSWPWILNHFMMLHCK